MNEPIFQVPAVRGSEAWQAGLQFIEKLASELTGYDLDDLDASERAYALDWLDRHPNDHEAAVHGVEPIAETVDECAASAAE